MTHICPYCGVVFQGHANRLVCGKPDCLRKRKKLENMRARREKDVQPEEAQPMFDAAYHAYILKLSEELRREIQANHIARAA